MKHRAQALTITAKGGLLRELHSKCRISPAFDPNTTPEDARPTAVPFKALWDTGASNSAITPKVVAACGLKPVGMTVVKTANGERNCETFLVNIVLPNNVEFGQWLVSCVETDEEVILGMDVITVGDFSITNQNANTVFSFRIPSLHTLDYVVETNWAIAQKQRAQAKKRRRASKHRRI